MSNEDVKEKERIDLVVDGSDSINAGKDTEPAEIQPVASREGSLIGGLYRIEECIGRGGMGEVYKARDISLNRWVAIKLLKKHLNEDSLRRFQQEGRALSQVIHPNIAAIHAISVTEDQTPFIVMEYVEGVPLSRIIRDESPLNIDWIINIIGQLSGALVALHRAGILHRDLKPDNMIVTRNASGVDVLKLVDFGIAKDLQVDQSLTQKGAIVGTPDYMSPERLEMKEVDARSDLYSVGCIFYELLTGTRPYEGDSNLAVMKRHLHDPIPPLPAKYRHLKKCLEKALAKNPEDRFQSIDEFNQQLLKDFYFHWRKLLLNSPPHSALMLMNSRKRPPDTERPMITFWILLGGIVLVSIVSMFLPKAARSTALLVECPLVVLWFIQMFKVFKANKIEPNS